MSAGDWGWGASGWEGEKPAGDHPLLARTEDHMCEHENISCKNVE